MASGGSGVSTLFSLSKLRVGTTVFSDREDNGLSGVAVEVLPNNVVELGV